MNATPSTVSLRVAGHPGPKGSHATYARRDGGVGVRHASATGRRWETTVAQEAMVARVEQCGCQTPPPPYSVTIAFFLARPKRPRYAWPVDADVDKRVRATVDGLVRGGLMVDDRHVVALHASANFTTIGESFALVTVRSCDLGAA